VGLLRPNRAFYINSINQHPVRRRNFNCIHFVEILKILTLALYIVHDLKFELQEIDSFQMLSSVSLKNSCHEPMREEEA